MNKKLILPPLLTSLIIMLLMGGGFFLFIAKSDNYHEEQVLEQIRQQQHHYSQIEQEINFLQDELASLNLDKESSEYQEKSGLIQMYKEQRDIMDLDITQMKEDLETAKMKSAKKFRLQILFGVGVTLLVSLSIGLIIFLLIKFDVFRNKKLRDVIYLIGFWISIIITLLIILDGKEKLYMVAICFAILSTGFLISHNLSKNKKEEQKEEKK